jgi:hypothetical protein
MEDRLASLERQVRDLSGAVVSLEQRLAAPPPVSVRRR